jgi:hypothetical protein
MDFIRWPAWSRLWKYRRGSCELRAERLCGGRQQRLWGFRFLAVVSSINCPWSIHSTSRAISPEFLRKVTKFIVSNLSFGVWSSDYKNSIQNVKLPVRNRLTRTAFS